MKRTEASYKLGHRDVSIRLVLLIPVLFLVFFGSYFLQKVSNSFPVWTFEPHILEKFKNILAGTLVDNLTFRKKDDIVKKIICLGCRLQKRDNHCDIHNMNHLSHELYNLKGCGTVQPCRYFIHEKGFCWSNQHFSC
ncbi:hypothetical protein TorRG33x02_320180, partial [Trema orientale]